MLPGSWNSLGTNERSVRQTFSLCQAVSVRHSWSAETDQVVILVQHAPGILHHDMIGRRWSAAARLNNDDVTLLKQRTLTDLPDTSHTDVIWKQSINQMNIEPLTLELQKRLRQPGRPVISWERWKHFFQGRWIIAILKHITKLRSTLENKIDHFWKRLELEIEIHGFIQSDQPQPEAIVDVRRRMIARPFCLLWPLD